MRYLSFIGVCHINICFSQIWFNKRYSKEYLANPELFGCHRVYDSKMESAALAKDFQKVLDALK